MAVLYVEVDEEITGALSRVRGSSDRRVALVLPPGSRIATGRINLRLLARESDAAGRELAIVCADEGARQLAVAAGLPAYASVIEYEAAVASGDPLRPPAPEPRGAARFEVADTRPLGGARSGAGSGARGIRGATPGEPHGILPPPAGSGTVRHQARDETLVTRGPGDVSPPGPPARVQPARRRSPLFLVAGLVLALLVTGVAAAVTVLPSASIRLTPRSEPAGPVRIMVVADPAADAVDPEANVIPARTVPITLTASGTFEATGRDVRSTRAGGRVRFLSENTVNDVAVPAGTRVATKDGVEFETREAVTVPQATFDPPQRGMVEVDVVAGRPGTEGNVPAGSIEVLPESLAAVEISVTNPAATTGGTRTETRFVSRADYDAGVRALTERLSTQLEQRLGDAGSFPEGIVIQRSSVRRGERRAEPAAGGLVGEEQERFELTVEETATVLGVDERRIVPLAEAALRARLAPGRELLAGSVRVASRVTAAGRERIEYAVEARAAQARALDAGALLAAVRGKALPEAERILAEYGQVSIETWPGYVTSIPTMEGRASLTIAASTPGGS